MIIDTHCHLTYEPLAGDIPAVLEEASRVGVARIIVPGTTVNSSQAAIALARQYPGQIYAAAGVHPGHASEEEDALIATLIPECVAVGEIGLDATEGGELAGQYPALDRQLQLADAHSKPIIVHSRDCFTQLHEVLAAQWKGKGAVIHCFTGTQEEATAWLDLGFHISLTGILTYKNAEGLREVAAWLPKDRVMVETDAPWLAPVPYRGKSCTPAMVVEVARTLAGLWEMSLEETARITTKNAETFFHL